jgi:CubicO group peptidase (beta-lactamase class C family)
VNAAPQSDHQPTAHEVLSAAAHRLVSEPPADAPDAAPPAGAVLGLHARGLTVSVAAGDRRRAPQDPQPMTVDTVHDLASVTKVVATTTMLMRLASAGEVTLEHPLTHYLPEFAGDGKDGVTIEHMLQHRGGLWEWQPLYHRTADRIEAMELAASLPLRYAPGTERHYSDLGFILLGRLVEVVTGLDLRMAFRTLVAEPLGLRSTGYGRPAGDDVATSAFDDTIEQRMVATGEPYPVILGAERQVAWRNRPLTGEVDDGNAFLALGGVSGHAGLFAPVADLLTWADAMAAYRDHPSLWRPEVAARFFTPGPNPGQALGFRTYPFHTMHGELTMLGHPGHVGFVPNRGIALEMATNRLLVDGEPAPTAALWHPVLDAAEHALRA